MSIRQCAAVAAMTLALSASLAGCGATGDEPAIVGKAAVPSFASLTADEMVAIAVEETKSVESLKVSGSGEENGQDISIDMAIGDEVCVGTVEADEMAFEIIHGPAGSFIRGNEAYWRESVGGLADQVMERLDGRWAFVSRERFDFSAFCSLDKLFDDVLPDSDAVGADKGRLLETDGVMAQELIVGSATRTTTVWVAVEGEHHILKVLEIARGALPVRMALSGFNEPIDASAPPKDEYVNLTAQNA